MPTALSMLEQFENETLGVTWMDAAFKESWMSSDRRKRLMGVLAKLNDLNTVNVQMWPHQETAVTFAGDGKALWLSYTGHAFHIWTNFGGSEDTFDSTANIILEDDSDADNRQTVVQIVRDYFRKELVEAS